MGAEICIEMEKSDLIGLSIRAAAGREGSHPQGKGMNLFCQGLFKHVFREEGEEALGGKERRHWGRKGAFHFAAGGIQG